MSYCTAKRTDGQPCKGQAITGATVCRVHGGSAAQVREKAAEARLTAQLNRELVGRGWEPVTDPAAVLADNAGEVQAWLQLCRERLAELATWEYRSDTGARDVVPVIALYERAQDRAVTTLAKMLTLGIQDRIARSAELTAEANLEAMRGLIRAARAQPDASEEELMLGLLGGTMGSTRP